METKLYTEGYLLVIIACVLVLEFCSQSGSFVTSILTRFFKYRLTH